MSELISGKDVVLALLEGKDLLWKKTKWEDDEKEPVHKSMWNIEELLTGKTVGREVVEFYLKPSTITLNNIEVPAPFEPKVGEEYWMVCSNEDRGYGHNDFESVSEDERWMQFGAWRTEEEIKQVVAALRSIFNPQ